MRRFELAPGGECLPMAPVDRYGHTMPDLGQSPEWLAAYENRQNEPIFVHIKPGRYDSCVSLVSVHDTALQSWQADVPVQFIEPAPWYDSPLIAPMIVALLCAVWLAWLWGRQKLAGPDRGHHGDSEKA